jgi:protein-S-isoprenylcysteine O-methyltransferase Ste14
VGSIDEEARPPLVTSGVYRYVRNPTYAGLFALNGGLWLIWPTPAVAAFALAFYLLIEMQVRCEEEYLLRAHGEEYRRYAAQVGRYVPWRRYRTEGK